MFLHCHFWISTTKCWDLEHCVVPSPTPAIAVHSQWTEGRMIHSHHRKGRDTRRSHKPSFMGTEGMVGAQAGTAELVFMGTGSVRGGGSSGNGDHTAQWKRSERLRQQPLCCVYNPMILQNINPWLQKGHGEASWESEGCFLTRWWWHRHA